MKVAAVIAEFNPFHNGHSYILSQAKEKTGADYCIALMSGDYVQRGEPALTDKYTRTQAALSNGADLVLELPVFFAAGSAEQFADGAVAILTQLNVVDTLVFGCESDDIAILGAIADVLASEPEPYRDTLKAALADGLSYAAANAKAVGACIPFARDATEQALKAPNNILAAAYLRAAAKQNSPLKGCAIRRIGGYHSDALTPPYASAAALRSFIQTHQTQPVSETVRVLTEFMPESAVRAMGFYDSRCYPVCEAPFSLLLHQKLISALQTQTAGTQAAQRFNAAGAKLQAKNPPALTAYCDVNDALANRIGRFLPQYRGFSQFAALCSSKALTLAHTRRALLHILLGVTNEHMAAAKALHSAPYVRMLGCKKEAAPLLHEIKTHTKIPFITKPAQAEDKLSNDAYTLWQLDIAASHTYQICLTGAYRLPFRNEYTRCICGLTEKKRDLI